MLKRARVLSYKQLQVTLSANHQQQMRMHIRPQFHRRNVQIRELQKVFVGHSWAPFSQMWTQPSANESCQGLPAELFEQPRAPNEGQAAEQ